MYVAALAQPLSVEYLLLDHDNTPWRRTTRAACTTSCSGRRGSTAVPSASRPSRRCGSTAGRTASRSRAICTAAREIGEGRGWGAASARLALIPRRLGAQEGSAPRVRAPHGSARHAASGASDGWQAVTVAVPHAAKRKARVDPPLPTPAARGRPHSPMRRSRREARMRIFWLRKQIAREYVSGAAEDRLRPGKDRSR